MIRRNIVCQNPEVHQYLRNDLEKRAKDFEINRREPRENNI